MRTVKLIGVLGVASFVTVTAWAPVAPACGGFFARRALEGERRPSLAYEQALIVYDAEQQREHFIREVAFTTAAEPFGFVVPTPARPEVAAVKRSPFTALRSSFPFAPEPPSGARGARSSAGAAPRSAGSGVQVLETRVVGSFTAFVLAASDERALADWLKQNGFVSTPETDAWLAHYVRLKFYYVAMRYEPARNKARARTASDSPQPTTQSETMRISFTTPLPYYPYQEPAHDAARPPGSPRLLELWLVSSEPFAPVAAQQNEAELRWVRPLAAGKTYAGDNRAALTRALGPEATALPAADVDGAQPSALVVQRFMDQKRSRSGFGDIVFVPQRKRALSAVEHARLAPLTPVLDPRLVEER